MLTDSELLDLHQDMMRRRELIKFDLTEKQKQFIKADCDEVLFGGSAGGGKSYGQLIDAWMKAIQYAGIRQLILRRTFPELKRSLIINSLMLFKQSEAKYSESEKKWKFNNGSTIEFGYCDSENDVTQYQSAEYDIVRFDELTHFTEFQYSYLISRIRGVNKFPKQIKSTTNPGSVGHEWVKRRFIEGKPSGIEFKDDLDRTMMFIPAKIYDNTFLMESDPKYVKRLEQLPENERRALLDGDWDIFEGQYFTEFRRETHVCDPFVIPLDWKRWVSMDYGLDMFAVVFIALSPEKKAYIYKEIYEKDLIISDAAKLLNERTVENIYQILAPPDLWNRRQDTGKSAVDIFRDNGVKLVKSVNDRVQGWYSLKEWLKLNDTKDEQTGDSIKSPSLKIFSNCVNLIRCLPALQRDKKDPNDISDQPHELTHIPDALRYFTSSFAKPNTEQQESIKGIWHRNELKMQGYKEYEINRLVKQGKVKLIGR